MFPPCGLGRAGMAAVHAVGDARVGAGVTQWKIVPLIDCVIFCQGALVLVLFLNP